MSRPTLVRFAVFLATVVATWGVLSLGVGAEDSDLEVGRLAPRDYTAQVAADVVDVDRTDEARQQARDSVQPALEVSTETQTQVYDQVDAVFDLVRDAVTAEPPAAPTTTIPPTTTTTVGEGEPVEPPPGEDFATVTGMVFLDIDTNPGLHIPGDGARVDTGLGRVMVTVSSGGANFEVESGPDGTWSTAVPAGEMVVTVDHDDADIPEAFVIGSDNGQQTLSCGAGDTCASAPVGLVPNLRDSVSVIEEITVSANQPLSTDTVAFLVATASEDVIRAAIGQTSRLEVIRAAALGRVLEEFGRGVTLAELPQARARQFSNPPLVLFDTGQSSEARNAAGEVVAAFLAPNVVIDQAETERAREEAAAAVEDVVEPYERDQRIVDQGTPLTRLHIDAIEQTRSVSPQAEGEGGLLAVLAVLVGLVGLYLARFRPEFWARPRMIALLGILMVLAGAAVRATVIVESQTSWYVLPAVAFGFMTAVLFDSRIGVLMAMMIGVLTALGARDTGVAVYGTLAAMAPIPFVSAVSSRGAFRSAVLFSSATAAVAAAATSWFFHVGPADVVVEVVALSAGWAFGVSVIASLVGLAGLQFFESAFDITTALRLLDLTDRNHEALQLLQEEAFGTFNHSLMVGTLAHAAARAIGANALLARAMAYYHDLGKTQNPTYFIENQFGASNPHDQLNPRESADIIRSHVTDGIDLARRFRIPSEVATGIVSHHGDGIMRYFFEKARTEEGDDVDPDDFRHIGHKPRTAESAIVMLADSLEAACRAVFQTEDPTPEAIEKVVNRVIDEKLDDGQLQDCPLTLGELTEIRRAFFESLVGHYHQRIAYPNFPGS